MGWMATEQGGGREGAGRTVVWAFMLRTTGKWLGIA